MICKFLFQFVNFWVKPTCWQKCLRQRYGSARFHFLIFILKDDRRIQFFIFSENTAQIFWVRKDVVSLPYFIVFGFLPYISLRALKLYVTGLLSF